MAGEGIRVTEEARWNKLEREKERNRVVMLCLLYTSDAADEERLV